MLPSDHLCALPAPAAAQHAARRRPYSGARDWPVTPAVRLHGAVKEQRRRTPAVAGVANRRFDVLALGSFVVLGLPDGMLGTAWPSMRATFGASVGDLGLILLVATAGSVLVTAFVGTLIQRLGVPALLSLRWGTAWVR
jgi:hypothetical protein